MTKYRDLDYGQLESRLEKAEKQLEKLQSWNTKRIPVYYWQPRPNVNGGRWVKAYYEQRAVWERAFELHYYYEFVLVGDRHEFPKSNPYTGKELKCDEHGQVIVT